ncbi:MAG TPA: hypothetical protein VJ144_10170, partial [Candidatus Polarisedimenticolia bacterium]|nr:hypothetical protein [Candidatus Polarisedimenticolia bacterium]
AARVWTVREEPTVRMTHSRPGQRRVPWSRLPLWLAALASFLPVAGFGGVRLESRPRDRVITIDGKAEGWQESTTVIERAQIAVALFNDRDDLYVCIKSWNEDLNFQAMNLGLTVWFDPDGGKQRSLGIEYPLMEDRVRSKDAGDPASGGAVSGGSAVLPARLAVRGPRADIRQVMAVPDAQGLEAKAAMAGGILIYELRVPLKSDPQHPYAIGAEAGRTIGVLLETTYVEATKEERSAGGGPRSGGRGGGAGGGAGGRRHGGGGGGTGRGGTSARETTPESPEIPKPVKIAFRVQLAPAK